jgi:hypothetical protein
MAMREATLLAILDRPLPDAVKLRAVEKYMDGVAGGASLNNCTVSNIGDGYGVRFDTYRDADADADADADDI